MTDDQVGDVLAALADPTRRRILRALGDAGGATATTLAASLPVSRQAVVKHLQVLEAAQVVARVRRGREVRYEVRVDPLDATSRWLAERSATWDRRPATIKQDAETTGGPAAAPS
ncbi:MAG: metalloregulator ArsR/SmtB family transcription factor [Pseudonocardia sp.]|nr:metalloregulator ArsR/SmtB family transcription factor [Pseudonocardia sp.]